MDSKEAGVIKPLPGWVLIEPLEEDQSVSGIQLPDSTQDYPMKGKVLKIWNIGAVQGDITITSFEDYKAAAIRQHVKENQTIYYKKFAGQEIKHEGKEYKLVEFKDLLAVVE